MCFIIFHIALSYQSYFIMISSVSIYYICYEYCVYQLRKESDYQLVHTLRKDYYIAVYITAQVYTYELHLILLYYFYTSDACQHQEQQQ